MALKRKMHDEEMLNKDLENNEMDNLKYRVIYRIMNIEV